MGRQARASKKATVARAPPARAPGWEARQGGRCWRSRAAPGAVLTSWDTSLGQAAAGAACTAAAAGCPAAAATAGCPIAAGSPGTPGCLAGCCACCGACSAPATPTSAPACCCCGGCLAGEGGVALTLTRSGKPNLRVAGTRGGCSRPQATAGTEASTAANPAHNSRRRSPWVGQCGLQELGLRHALALHPAQHMHRPQRAAGVLLPPPIGRQLDLHAARRRGGAGRGQHTGQGARGLVCGVKRTSRQACHNPFQRTPLCSAKGR